MCMVSVIAEHFGGLFGQSVTNTDPSVYPRVVTAEQWNEYLRLKAMAAELDRAMGQPDCDTEAKTAWEKSIEARLKQAGL